MTHCEVCGLPYVSETAFTLAVKCNTCGRLTCPDCQRYLIADNGHPVGTYCTDCAANDTFGSTYRRAFTNAERDITGKPIIRVL